VAQSLERKDREPLAGAARVRYQYSAIYLAMILAKLPFPLKSPRLSFLL
jgi:hypothetical protein